MAEWEVRKAMATGNQGQHKVEDTEIDKIKKLMPDDFNRKLREWEQKKERPRDLASPARDTGGSSAVGAPAAAAALRRKSSSSSTSLDATAKKKGSSAASAAVVSKKRREKYGVRLATFDAYGGPLAPLVGDVGGLSRDLAWFDKELEKIKRGKERLERERQIFQVR